MCKHEILCVFEEGSSIAVENKIRFFGRVFGKRHGDSLGVLFDVSWEKNCIG